MRIWLIALLFPLPLMAQRYTRWSAGPTAGSIIAHSRDVENTKGARPFGAEWSYSWRTTDSTSLRKFGGFPWQGFQLSGFHFDNAVLGWGLQAGYFLEPNWQVNDRCALVFRSTAGISYQSNPYHPVHHPTNNSYSTHLSFYLAVGTGVRVNLNRRWSIAGSLQYRHLSNGGISLPNKGVNWLTGDVQLQWQPGGMLTTTELKALRRQRRWTKMRAWQLAGFAGVRSISNEAAQVYPVTGLLLQRFWQTHASHAFTAGTEWYRDGSLPAQLRADNLPEQTSLRGAVLAGHVFTWGKFHLAQQVGIYVLDKSVYYPAWYHRWWSVPGVA